MSRAGDPMLISETHPATCIQLVGLEPSAASAVLRILEGAGYWNVLTLPHPERIDLAADLTSGVALVDVGPGSDLGTDDVHALTAARGPDVRVVAVTSSHSVELRARAVAAGASAVLTLPAETSEVLRTLGVMVEVHRAHKELRFLKALSPTGDDRDASTARDHAEVTLLARLATLVERTSSELGRHSRRVAKLADDTAAAMGLDEESGVAVRRAARAHDLGKLAVPRALLDTTAKLGRADIEVLRTHAMLGANMLKGGDGPVLRLAHDVALSHHEWWDGSGYPQGLAGEGIPLAARIVSVVDAFDAMTNDRTYRQALTPTLAVGELEKWSGTQFDPSVVAAFLGVLESDLALRGCGARARKRP